MIWIVAVAFEKDIFGPDATSDTTTVLGACFNGWSLSDSLPVRWGITGGDIGWGIAGLLDIYDTSRIDLNVRQAFCKARHILEPYSYSRKYYEWMGVYPKDELSSCGEMVLSYLKEKYPELLTFKCDMMNYRATCEKQRADHLRRILFKDVEDFLKRLDREKVSASTFNNLGVVVLFYESIGLYVEKGYNPFKGGR